ncbi:hypothetical protein QTO34_010013 [Cnephaeus nilssonii]|uniref:KRAB domain-containing protein n=1 Tax=Cnephaeus nilssonii TaxID=3371016 RepID=A0AA40HEK2_CNENI|nr:hypothetical protein QTO34_010013 [Eptesicus nilssonii]
MSLSLIWPGPGRSLQPRRSGVPGHRAQWGRQERGVPRLTAAGRSLLGCRKLAHHTRLGQDWDRRSRSSFYPSRSRPAAPTECNGVPRVEACGCGEFVSPGSSAVPYTHTTARVRAAVRSCSSVRVEDREEGGGERSVVASEAQPVQGGEDRADWHLRFPEGVGCEDWRTDQRLQGGRHSLIWAFPAVGSLRGLGWSWTRLGDKLLYMPCAKFMGESSEIQWHWSRKGAELREEEWSLLDEGQRQLYLNVMLENFELLSSLGKTLTLTSDQDLALGFAGPIS